MKVKHPLVLVEWEDSAATMDGWKTAEQRREFTCCSIRSVGFLIHDDAERIVISGAMSVHEEHEAHFGDVWSIPRGSVVRVTRIKDRMIPPGRK